MAERRRSDDKVPGLLSPEEPEETTYTLDIEIREQEGVLWIYDPRAFHPGRRSFCRRLIESVMTQPGVRRAEVRLDTSCCRIDFDRKSATPRRMSEAFSAAVRSAIPEPGGRWWPRSWFASPRWTGLTAYQTPDGISTWEILEASPERLRLHHPSLTGDRAQLARLADAIADVEGVACSQVSSWSHTLTLQLAGPVDPSHLIDLVQEIEADRRTSALPAVRESHGGIAEDAELATGPRRLLYLALAGGSFTLTAIGLVVPGMPTVPFLLATSYYLSRSSPWLDERLRRAPLFGPILVEWEEQHGLGFSSKLELVGLTLVIVLVTIILAPVSPIALTAIALMSSVSIVGIAQLPGPDTEPSGDGSAVQPIPRALPAH